MILSFQRNWNFVSRRHLIRGTHAETNRAIFFFEEKKLFFYFFPPTSFRRFQRWQSPLQMAAGNWPLNSTLSVHDRWMKAVQEKRVHFLYSECPSSFLFFLVKEYRVSGQVYIICSWWIIHHFFKKRFPTK